jgi:hypothetical protein
LKKTLWKSSVFVCFMLALVLNGCGLKANPVPVRSVPDYRMMVKDLQALASDEAVIVKWNFHDIDGKIDYINIEKSEVGTAGNECKDCPRTFERVGQMQIQEVISDKRVSSALSYTDKKVVKGRIYNYRLILCENDGICQEASMAEINYK